MLAINLKLVADSAPLMPGLDMRKTEFELKLMVFALKMD